MAKSVNAHSMSILSDRLSVRNHLTLASMVSSFRSCEIGEFITENNKLLCLFQHIIGHKWRAITTKEDLETISSEINQDLWISKVCKKNQRPLYRQEGNRVKSTLLTESNPPEDSIFKTYPAVSLGALSQIEKNSSSTNVECRLIIRNSM